MAFVKHSLESKAKMSASQRKRCNHPDYISPTQKYKRGDSYICKRYGYKMVYIPEYYNTNKNFVPEHRLVAEKALGRRLRRREVVHHINDDKTDNRNINLLICNQKYHAALHARMATLYQQEHFGGL